MLAVFRSLIHQNIALDEASPTVTKLLKKRARKTKRQHFREEYRHEGNKTKHKVYDFKIFSQASMALFWVQNANV